MRRRHFLKLLGAAAATILAPVEIFEPKRKVLLQKFTSGSGTYTVPPGYDYIKVTLVGGGGGSPGKPGSIRIDGVELKPGDKVLQFGQAKPQQNVVYVYEGDLSKMRWSVGDKS